MSVQESAFQPITPIGQFESVAIRSDPPQVYAAIAAVQAEIAQSGIAKSRKNVQQGYNFRGIDDVYNALAPVLAKHNLVVIPRYLSRIQTERETKSGSVIFSVVVEGEFDFVSALDGSKHTARAFGEAMDTADKATNKAMSASYKYAAFQTFCIPTEGDNDADATHHDVASARQPQAQQQQRKQPEGVTTESGDLPITTQGPDGKAGGQKQRLVEILKAHNVPVKDFGRMLVERYGYTSFDVIKRKHYDAIVALAQGWKPREPGEDDN